MPCSIRERCLSLSANNGKKSARNGKKKFPWRPVIVLTLGAVAALAFGEFLVPKGNHVLAAINGLAIGFSFGYMALKKKK
jgi:uncharacterized membrane protein YfcA